METVKQKLHQLQLLVISKSLVFHGGFIPLPIYQLTVPSVYKLLKLNFLVYILYHIHFLLYSYLPHSLCIFSSVQSLSCVRLFITPWTTAWQTSLSITNSQNLLKLISVESVMPSNHLILCRLLFLPSIFPSTRLFSNESALRIRWPKYWSFSFSISPSNEHPGLISFRMDWLDLLVIQGTFKSLLQHHSSKA